MTPPTPAIVQRISEALDTEIINQRRGVTTRPFDACLDLDAERLALAAVDAIAGHMREQGFVHPSNWLRSLLR
jgi:hypothetical protein